MPPCGNRMVGTLQKNKNTIKILDEPATGARDQQIALNLDNTTTCSPAFGTCCFEELWSRHTPLWIDSAIARNSPNRGRASRLPQSLWIEAAHE